MVLHDSVSGTQEGTEGHDQHTPFSRRRQHSVENIPDFTLRIQYEVLETLGLSENREGSADFLIKFGKALRKIIDTYEEVSGQRPTVHDIIWCLGYDLHIDPQREVQILKQVA